MNESREETDFLAVNLEVAGITKGNPPPPTQEKPALTRGI